MSKRLFSQVASNEQEESSRSAIPLSKAAPDLVNGIPVSGEDYLLVVRQQAQKCAKTVVAARPKEVKKISLPSHFQFFDNTLDDTEHQASKMWREGFVKPFRSYQKSVQRNKKPTKTHKEITSIDEAFKLLYVQKSGLEQLIPTFTQHTILRLLQYHVQWIDTLDDIEAKCRSMFFLLVYLDPVLTSKNISTLRDLSRECIKIRPKCPDHIGHLNIIITIISGVFGQADLV